MVASIKSSMAAIKSLGGKLYISLKSHNGRVESRRFDPGFGFGRIGGQKLEIEIVVKHQS